MTRKILNVAVLAVVSTSALLAVGCSSGPGGDGAYRLTGSSSDYNDHNSRREAARGNYSTSRAEEGMDHMHQ